MKLVHARVGLAPRAEVLLQFVRQCAQPLWQPTSHFRIHSTTTEPGPISDEEAIAIYRGCMERWHILERFPQPDWSIVDLWVARYLLSQGKPAPQIQTILRLGSPHFPRRHGDPDGYLRRTVARAAFPAPGRTVCDGHDPASVPLDTSRVCSNSTGGW